MKLTLEERILARANNLSLSTKCWKKNSQEEQLTINSLHNSFDIANCDQEAISIMHLVLNEIITNSKDFTFRELFKIVIRDGHTAVHKRDKSHHVPNVDEYKNLNNLELLRIIENNEEDHAILFFGFISLFIKEKFTIKLIPILKEVINYTRENKQNHPPFQMPWPDIPERSQEEVSEMELISKLKKIDYLAKKFNMDIKVILQELPRDDHDDFERVNGSSHIVPFPDNKYKGIIVIEKERASQKIKNFLLFEDILTFNYRESKLNSNK